MPESLETAQLKTIHNAPPTVNGKNIYAMSTRCINLNCFRSNTHFYVIFLFLYKWYQDKYGID